jgi:hypothetical protein
MVVRNTKKRGNHVRLVGMPDPVANIADAVILLLSFTSMQLDQPHLPFFLLRCSAARCEADRRLSTDLTTACKFSFVSRSRTGDFEEADAREELDFCRHDERRPRRLPGGAYLCGL